MHKRIAVLSLLTLVTACGGGMDSIGLPPPACTGFRVDECEAVRLAASEGLARDVRERAFVSATVRRIDPLDASLCADYGVCEPAVAAALVDLVYVGPQGPESWPVAVIKRGAASPFVAPMPFPDSE